MTEAPPKASYPAEASSLDSPTVLMRGAVSTLRRVVIEHVEPEIDGGRYPIKRTIGDKVRVTADLDPRNRQSGWVSVITEELGLGSQESYQVHDLWTDARYGGHGSRNFVHLGPAVLPARIVQVHAIG